MSSKNVISLKAFEQIVFHTCNFNSAEFLRRCTPKTFEYLAYYQSCTLLTHIMEHLYSTYFENYAPICFEQINACVTMLQ
jgi:hypothetical protein